MMSKGGAPTGGTEGSNNNDQENNNGNGYLSSSSSQPNKGQWERRLQTDIQMAKQALCEALSIDKPSPSTLNHQFPIDTTLDDTKLLATSQSTLSSPSSYASSADNIARLLQSWMVKKSPPPAINSFSGSNSSEGAHSGSGTTTTNTPDQGFDYSSLLSSSNMSNNNLSDVSIDSNINNNSLLLQQEESKPCIGDLDNHHHHQNQNHVPFTLLENWLFDDATASQVGHEEDLLTMSSLQESTADLFHTHLAKHKF